MRWLAARAEEAGARIRLSTPFHGASRTQSGFELGGHGAARYLVAADGPKSAVAKALGLGRNQEFLFGIEHEYDGVEIDEPDKLHCFIDRQLAPGYIAWMVAGPNALQVGLAYRMRGARRAPGDAALFDPGRNDSVRTAAGRALQPSAHARAEITPAVRR